MKTFNIYEHSVVTSQVVAVKQGWSWLAFFFPVVYSIIKKNWLAFLISFFGSIVIWFLLLVLLSPYTANDDSLATGAGIWTNIIISIFMGIKFNAFLDSGLIKKGFVLKETIMSQSKELALMEYLQRKGGKND